ncbi:hypothetical protein GOP47_0018632 [Adiantum capillus-veneris]|uniref:BHLH domain-containing protein n=1 Tax=Adiantum capillus-veneris TaxID=13818 RepID=A0A9D4Z8C4_ADICA|nr:hypothetical protein GOP47_0018632 [Adiantum capillus-veneris]
MSSPASGWISFWEQNLLGDQQHPDFEWSDPGLEDAAIKGDSFNIQCSSISCSTENENSKGDSFHQDSKKRPRDDGSSGVQGKACREKMRRDRMNDRFVELSAVLEPDKPPKTDKASILRDAARIISQLRAESRHYKETNSQLHDTIKELKAEKNELREEKLSLKAEKERLQKRLKAAHVMPGYTAQSALPIHGVGAVSLPTSSVNHNFYANAAGAPPGYAHHQNNTAILSKPPLYSDMPFSGTMSQWIPPEVADVSKDHVLRPPVA